MNTKLSNLRALFEQYNIYGYIIPHSDEYQNEYTPDCSKRLEYMTGFTGSNGITIITKDKQYFWTDGRYQLQARQEMPSFIICARDFEEVARESGNDKIGYNPMLFTSGQIEAFSKKINLVPISEDLVDKIWSDKPNAPNSESYLYPIEYAGQDVPTKLEIVRKNFLAKASNALITQPDSICWLLNIRGADIESVPVILGYLILSQNNAIFFTDLSRISSEIKYALENVEFKERDEIFDILSNMKGSIRPLSKLATEEQVLEAYGAQNRSVHLVREDSSTEATTQLPSEVEFRKRSIMVDPNSCPLGLVNLIANKIEGMNPCLLPKSCKNELEIKCAKQGHIKDAVALCTGLAWVQNNPGITEHDISLKLTELRSKQESYVTNSFPTIAGFRENGAIIHYKPKIEGSKVIVGDGMLLIDSGAHYLGCTTDVTRVLVFGNPTDEQKRRYTQVLKGHIALAICKFPAGTFGCNIDILARQYLWADGVDYAHGTGHGVGNMLSVHEAPGYIGQAKTNVPLQEGMIVSNEPGFYKEGEFGIRIENLMYVKKSSDEGFLEFEMLTLVPYARDLIDVKMLTDNEWEYLKGYYQKIRELVLPLLTGDAKIWCEIELSYIKEIELDKK